MTSGCAPRDDFAVFLNGQPTGVQGLSAVSFPVRREVATGSWLGLPCPARRGEAWKCPPGGTVLR